MQNMSTPTETETELARANAAAQKGEAARMAASGMEQEIADLRAQILLMQEELDAVRAQRDQHWKERAKIVDDIATLLNSQAQAWADRDAACAYAGKLRDTITAMMSAEGSTVYRTAWVVMLELGRAALALTPPDALAAQQAETARLKAEHRAMEIELYDQQQVKRDDDGRLVWLSDGSYVADTQT